MLNLIAQPMPKRTKIISCFIAMNDSCSCKILIFIKREEAGIIKNMLLALWWKPFGIVEKILFKKFKILIVLLSSLLWLSCIVVHCVVFSLTSGHNKCAICIFPAARRQTTWPFLPWPFSPQQSGLNNQRKYLLPLPQQTLLLMVLHIKRSVNASLLQLVHATASSVARKIQACASNVFT